MAMGTVKWFNNRKGYGFIQPEEGGRDVFVHISALEEAGLKSLRENERIEYQLIESRGKTVASNLRVFGGGGAADEQEENMEMEEELVGA